MHRRLALADAGRTFDDDEPRWQALLTIEAALTRIHAPVRAAFELVELRGLSATEAATHLGVPISTIYGRLAIARRDLKRIYAELGVAPSNRRRNQKKASRSKVPALFLARLETGWGSKLVAAVIAMCTLAGVVIVAKRIEEREQRDGAPSMSPRKPEPAPVTWFERSEARIPPGHTSTQAGKRRLETASSPVPSVDPQPGRGSSSLRRPPIRRNPVAASSDSTSVEEADTDGAGADSRSADDLGREVALLRAAKDALRRADGSRALKILDRHGRRYPDGALEQARLATRVRALCSLGRIAEASALAKRLRQRQSGTTLLPPRSPCEPKISISKEVDAGD